MIRWHSQKESYSVAYPLVRTSETNKDEMATVVPFWRRKEQVEHFCVSTRGVIEAGLRAPGSGGRGTHAIARTTNELPLLLLPIRERFYVRTDALGEGIHTGLVNATSGALLGLIAWGLAGPVGGALIWCGTGAAVTGAATGMAQSRAIEASENRREFAAKCNEFLREARAGGLTAATVGILEACQKEADCEFKRALVRDLAALCLEYYGSKISAPVVAKLQLLAPDARMQAGIEDTRLPLGIRPTAPLPGQRRRTL